MHEKENRLPYQGLSQSLAASISVPMQELTTTTPSGAIKSGKSSSSNLNDLRQATLGTKSSEIPIIKPTSKRFLILFLYGICSMEKSFQWINLSTITNKVTQYYGVSNMAVNWTSVLFMITFIPLVLPTGWLIGRIGLRKAVLIGSFGITIGAVIKCFSCAQDRFYVIILGQIVVSLSEQFIFCIPARVASVWFPDHQVSLATGFGIFGNQCGIALGFLIPQLMLDGADNPAEIGVGLFRLFTSTAGVAAVTLLLLLVVFDDAPKHAPGVARIRRIQEEQEELQRGRSFGHEMRLFGTLLLELITERNCALLVSAYGVNVGTGYAIQTLLNQMIAKEHWEDANQLVGQAGLVIIVSGMIGALFWGHLCDTTRRYITITKLLYLGVIVSTCLLGTSIYLCNEPLLYLSSALVGFHLIGYTVAGIDTVVEITYPAPELISTSVANLAPQIFGVGITFVASMVVDNHGGMIVSFFLAATFFFGLIINMTVRERLKRQSAVLDYDKDKGLRTC